MSRPQESADRGRKPFTRLVGWQGFTFRVPDAWDLTGFSGRHESGYLRVDDSEEQGIEVKWSTEPKGSKRVPDVTVRRESYFRALKDTARKKKIELTLKEVDAPRPILRDGGERTAAGFTWLGDRKAIGAVWHCAVCRRVVIAQVLGDRSGKGSLGTVAEKVLGSFACHDAQPGWRVWSLYDLYTEVPSEWTLESQQLMNVYLRLTFAKSAARLSVEQWSAANVARRDAYLDGWLAANAKGEMSQSRWRVEETEARGHPALRLTGGPKLGLPMAELTKQIGRLQRPATRFTGVGWECAVSNKIHLVEALRPAAYPDPVEAVAGRTRCHGVEQEEGAGPE